MNPNYLDFEQPIADLEAKIEELRLVGTDNKLDISAEITRLQEQSKKLTKNLYKELTAAQVVKVSRHPKRPYTRDYIEMMMTDFDEMHGDRHFGDDKAIIGGTARLDGRPVMVIGHQKGRTVPEKVSRNFGMPRPEGYRKALRLMEVAERFHLPILTFIDTPGAYPGIDAEERGQSEAIAYNLLKMSNLRTPIIATVTGEGGSGGALAIGVCDQLNMLEHSIYSVISPEGCASILWKTADKSEVAAEAMGLSAPKVLALGIANAIIKEPLGGGHRNPEELAASLKANLIEALDTYCAMPIDSLLERRYERLMSYGR